MIIIGFEATGEADVVTPAALTWQAETVHAFENIPHVLRVESLISMETPHVTFSLPPKSRYEPIISETPVSAETAEILRDRLAQTEMPFGSLVSKDYKMAAELVVFDATQQDFDAMEKMVKNVDETLAKFPVPAGYRTVVSGLPVLRVGIVRDLGKDQTRLMPLAGILYLITLAPRLPQPFRQPAAVVRGRPGADLDVRSDGSLGPAAQYRQQHFALHAADQWRLEFDPCSDALFGRGGAAGHEPQGRQPPHDPPDAGGLSGRVRHGGRWVLRSADGQFPRAAGVSARRRRWACRFSI